MSVHTKEVMSLQLVPLGTAPQSQALFLSFSLDLVR